MPFLCGGSLLFDGTNDLVKVPDSDALDLVGDKLTLSCWVKRSAAASGNLVKKANASNGYRLWITATGALQFEVLIGGTTKSVTSTTTIPLNTWKHVAARYDGSELRVFIGGTIEAASTAATGSLVATTEALWLGYYDGTSHHLNGYLDDVSIYARALSDTEITNLSNNQMGRYEYHHTNALGSNIVLTDDDQNVIVRYEYDVFGAVRSETGTSDNPRKFTGKEYESDVKLYYFAARYYDPYIGRFVSRDPAGDGLNWYVYVGNNPLAFLDPTGLRALSALETSAVNFVFQGTVDPSKLDIEIVEGLGDRGRYTFNTGKMQIRASLYEDAGLNENSTLANTDILNPNVINYLSTVIHEATHYWQEKFNRHTTVSDYNFTESELFHNRLGNEQHASAAQVYFIIAWQVEHGANVIDLSWNYVSVGPVERYDAIKAIKPQTTQRLVTKNTARGLLYNFINFTQALRDGRRATTWGAIKR